MDGFFPFILLIGAIVCLAVVGLALAVVWEILKIFRDRREFQLLIRRHEESLRTRQPRADSRGIVWDRDYDGKA